MFIVPYHKTVDELREAIDRGEDIPIHTQYSYDGVVPKSGVITVGSGPRCHPAAQHREGVRWSCHVRLSNGKIVAMIKEYLDEHN
jgi:hypothetical protein